MATSLEQFVRARAGDLCEYCHAAPAFYPERFQLDHVLARQHHGETEAENLALCCLECNRRKGPNLSGVDPLSKQIVLLFHPRKDQWREHFKWDNAILVGLTATGRATVDVLQINRPPRIVVRQTLIVEGVFPPAEDIG